MSTPSPDELILKAQHRYAAKYQDATDEQKALGFPLCIYVYNEFRNADMLDLFPEPYLSERKAFMEEKRKIEAEIAKKYTTKKDGTPRKERYDSRTRREAGHYIKPHFRAESVAQDGYILASQKFHTVQETVEFFVRIAESLPRQQLIFVIEYVKPK